MSKRKKQTAHVTKRSIILPGGFTERFKQGQCVWSEMPGHPPRAGVIVRLAEDFAIVAFPQTHQLTLITEPDNLSARLDSDDTISSALREIADHEDPLRAKGR